MLIVQFQQKEAINKVKARWHAHQHEVEAWITASGVDKRSYSSRFLPKWIEEITLWASTSETKSYQLPDCLVRFSQETLNEKSTKGPAHHKSHQKYDIVGDPYLGIHRSLQQDSVHE